MCSSFPARTPLAGHRCFHSSCCRRRGLGAASPPADSGLWFHCEECRRVHQVLSGYGFGARMHPQCHAVFILCACIRSRTAVLEQLHTLHPE